MKIFDCFTFYNELDLLEIRLEELWNSVDYFIIAEATHTHQAQPKSLFLKDNWNRFQKYHSKIRHVIVEDMPNSEYTWTNENHQRRAIQRGLWDLQPEDYVIVSDCDEVPRASVIDQIATKDQFNKIDRFHLYCPLSVFRINYVMSTPRMMFPNIAVTKGSVFTDPQSERSFGFPQTPKPGHIQRIDHGGWHFSYLGNTEFAKTKIQSFAHKETNTPDMLANLNVEDLVSRKLFIGGESGVERYEYTRLDNYYPEYIIANRDKFSALIVNSGTTSVYDLYPA